MSFIRLQWTLSHLNSKKMKKLTITTLFIYLFSLIQAQVIISSPVSIDPLMSDPDESAILDLKSSTKGILVPRMASTQRENIVDPALGLLVFDYDENAFMYFNGLGWAEIGNGILPPSTNASMIADTNQDTWLTTEQTPNEDKIRFFVDSTNFLTADGKTFNLIAPGNSLFIGLNAGVNDDTTNNHGTFIGLNSGYNNIGGFANTFTGSHSGFSNEAGSYNSFYGYYAGYNNTSGFYNTFNGFFAGYNNTIGNSNAFYGPFSGYNNTTGNHNCFYGVATGYYNTSGSFNIFLGRSAGNKNTSGHNNSFIGAYAGYSNTTGFYNIGIGRSAGRHSTSANSNIYLGYNAGYYNQTGSRLIYIGRDAGQQNTTGYQNVFIGNFSGLSNTTGYYNTIIGDDAGKNNTTGYYNTFIGLAAGWNNQGGNNNTMLGGGAGFSNVSGSENLFVGRYAGFGNVTGLGNVFMGTFAGQGNTTGDNNTFVGTSAGEDNSSGINNVYIGTEAGKNNILGTGNVSIGYKAGFNETEDNKLHIDNNGNAVPLIHGDFSPNDLALRKVGINRIASTNTLEVGGNASKSTPGSWLGNSDIRLKKNIKTLECETILQQLLKLEGINYEWNDSRAGMNRPNGSQYGFSAQNIQSVFPEMVSEDKDGYLQTAYGSYDPLLVEAIRALANRNDALAKRIELLEQKFKQLRP